MNDTAAMGPARLVEMVTVARRFFADGQTKSEIATELGINRFKVARLIEEAKATGIVRVEISAPGRIDVELSARLREELGLTHAVVLDSDAPDEETQRDALGASCAELLQEILTSDDILGLAWGRSIRSMSLSLRSLPACPVVQLSGALRSSMPRPDLRDSTIELVRRVAAITEGPAAYFYAPMIVPNAPTADTLREQPDVARALALASQATVAVVGIGAWEQGQSTVFEAFSPDESAALRDAHGVLVEVAGILLDTEGEPIANELTQRMITIDANDLRDIPEVIAIAYGEPKARAVRTAIASGHVNGLVTHPALATALLELAGEADTA